ncbi:MAG: hypothetical protein Q7S62_00450 [bacterium]|nr:hypothetical protein [bacterium]
MNHDFFIKLTLGAYRVTDLLPPAEHAKAEIRSLANAVLVNLILFSENNPITSEQRKSLIPKIQEEIGSLVGYVIGLKSNSKIETKYLLILEKEYQKIAQWLDEQSFDPSTELGAQGRQAQVSVPVEVPQKKEEDGSLSERQRKIMGILQNKEKTQVWELQKVLTEVTKRTLRRDLDDLLQHNLIERKGEWNAVFYRMKQ